MADLRITIYDLDVRALARGEAERMRSGILSNAVYWLEGFVGTSCSFSGLLPSSRGNAWGNGLNESGDDFIGTRVTRPKKNAIPTGGGGVPPPIYDLRSGSSAATPRIGQTRSILENHHHDDRWLSRFLDRLLSRFSMRINNDINQFSVDELLSNSFTLVGVFISFWKRCPD